VNTDTSDQSDIHSCHSLARQNGCAQPVNYATFRNDQKEQLCPGASTIGAPVHISHEKMQKKLQLTWKTHIGLKKREKSIWSKGMKRLEGLGEKE